MINLAETFDNYRDEYHRFDGVKNKLHARPDLCAFLLLDQLVPGTGRMVCAVEKDEIYLDVDPEKLAEVATENDVLTLVRCGVLYDATTESLSMFV